MTQPSHIEQWNGLEPKLLEDFEERYRPKEIHRYQENGYTVRVFEPAWAIVSLR